MSYLPASSLYHRDPEPRPTPTPEVAATSAETPEVESLEVGSERERHRRRRSRREYTDDREPRERRQYDHEPREYAEREPREHADRERNAYEHENRERQPSDNDRDYEASERRRSEREPVVYFHHHQPLERLLRDKNEHEDDAWDANALASASARPKPTMMMGSKEWLIAPQPPRVEAPVAVMPPMVSISVPVPTPVPDTVTVPSSKINEPQLNKRNFLHKAQKVVLRHLDKAKTTPALPSEPDLLWFAVMVFGSVCMGLMIWGAYSALPRFGNYSAPLRADAHSPKFKVTSDVPVKWIQDSGHPHVPNHVPPLVPPMPAIPVSAPFPPLETRLPEPPEFHHGPVGPRLPEAPPMPVEHPLVPLPARPEPTIFVQAHLGETPMIRTWKKLADASLLLAAFSVAPTNPLLAQIPDKVTPFVQPGPDNSKQLDALTKAVQALSDQMGNLKLDDKLNAVKSELNDKITKIKLDAPKGVDNSNEFLLLANRLEQMEKLLDRFMKSPLTTPAAPGVAANGNLEDIKSKLGNIEQAILKLQPTEKRIALAPPSPEPAIVNKSGNAHVIFVNLYTQDLWLWVNQKPHRVPANTTLTLDTIAAGPAIIEVRSPEGVFHKANPTLVVNETFTLTAR